MSINDVAKRAGVSNSTVSRVINNHPRVAPETARTVRQVMTELGYVPSDRRPGPKPASRNVAKIHNIAFLIFGSSNHRTTPAFESLIRGVTQGSDEQNMVLSLFHLHSSDDMPTRLIDSPADGVLLHGVIPSGPIIRRLQKLPTVWLMGNHRRPDWGDQVMPDSYEIGTLAARYMIDRGHKRLAFLNMDAAHWPFRLYYQSFAAAAEELGASVTRVDDVPDPSADYWFKYRPESVEQLVTQYLNLNPRPTGIFVADDMQVAMIQPVLQRRGVKIGPGQVEVISCNNEQPYLVGLNPRPAVIDIRAESIGRRGVAQLQWRIEHPEVSERMISLVEPDLVTSETMAQASAPSTRTASSERSGTPQPAVAEVA